MTVIPLSVENETLRSFMERSYLENCMVLLQSPQPALNTAGNHTGKDTVPRAKLQTFFSASTSPRCGCCLAPDMPGCLH